MAPRPRFDKLEPERQEEILSAAAVEFAASGFEGASLNAILATAGVSKGAFYYYFDDKADLFVTVLKKTVDEVFSAVPFDLDALTGTNFWATLEQLNWHLLAVAEEHPHLLGMGKAFYRLPEAMRTTGAIAEYLEQHGQLLFRLTERARELGCVRTDLPTAMLVELAMAVDMVFDKWIVEHWGESREEVVDLMKTFFLIQRRLLEPPAPTQLDAGPAPDKETLA